MLGYTKIVPNFVLEILLPNRWSVIVSDTISVQGTIGKVNLV